jgi:hypothetical protein
VWCACGVRVVCVHLCVIADIIYYNIIIVV